MSEQLPVDPATVALLRAAGCVYAEDEARILTEAAESAEALKVLLDRRADGEPLEYVVGWAEFCGLRIRVRSGVFVPRRRSEFLAECAVELAGIAAARCKGGPGRARVLDLCCGSGAIGLAVATGVPGVDLVAVDDSPLAVECARENLASVHGEVYEGDLFAALPRNESRDVDVVVASPPYVPTSEIRRLPAEARSYEPASTLDGGPDGTEVQRRILRSARDWLRAPGCVLVETGPDMAEATARIGRGAGFQVEVRRDPDRGAAVVVARRR